MPIRIERRGPQRTLRVKPRRGHTIPVTGGGGEDGGEGGGGSSPVEPPSNPSPGPVIASAEPGVYRVGVLLSVTPGTYTGTIETRTYQWQRDGSDITDADGPFYTPVVADVDATLTCVETVGNSGGSLETASAGVGPVLAEVEPDPGVPVLAAVSETFGAWTVAGRGAVRLSSTTLGLLTSGAVTSWSITQTGGTSGHFNGYATGVPVVLSEGATAVTPVPSTAGRTAKLNGGPYTFSITATNDDGTSEPITWTRTIDPNSVTIGDDGNTAFTSAGSLYGVSIAAYVAATSAPRYVLFARGLTNLNLSLNNFDWTAGPVTFKDADPAFPSVLSRLNIQNAHYVTVDGFTFSGAYGSGGRIRLAGNIGTSHITIQNCNIGLELADLQSGKNGIVANAANVTDIIIQDNRFRYSSLGITIVDGNARWIIRRNTCRYAHEGYISVRDCDDILIEDNYIMSFLMIPGSGLHPDAFQKNDNCSATNITFRRFLVMSADSTLGCQGIYNGPTDSPAALNWTIDGMGYCGWNVTGISLNSNDGTSEVTHVTMVKSLTGDPSDAPFGAGWQTEGPSLFCRSGTAGWNGDMLIHDCFVADDISMLGTPLPTPTVEDCVAANRDAATIAATFVNGNPNTSLSAITMEEWAEMDEAEVIAVHMAALASSDPRTAINEAGEWRT